MIINRYLINRQTIIVLLVMTFFSVVMVNWFPGGLLVWSLVATINIILWIIWQLLYLKSNGHINFLLSHSIKKKQHNIDLLMRELVSLDQAKAAKQLDLIQKKFNDLSKVLKSRFSENELTFDRYMSGAKSLYESVFRNLREIIISINSVSSTNINVLNNELINLKEDKENNNAEILAIEERVNIYNKQINKVDDLLVLNEETITLMAKMSSEWANANFGQDADLESANVVFEQVEVLIKRIQKYR